MHETMAERLLPVLGGELLAQGLAQIAVAADHGPDDSVPIEARWRDKRCLPLTITTISVM
jgi:hypothetical protein